jgi:hypothetical protein
LLLVVLAIIGLCLGITALAQNAGQHRPNTLLAYNGYTSRLIALPDRILGQPAFIAVESDSGSYPDLFLYTGVLSGTRTNLTRTSGITETSPVLDTRGTKVAFYGSKDSMLEVYVQEIPGGISRPITEQSKPSGLHEKYEVSMSIPPSFSPDGNWVAFPAISTVSNTLELAVARSDATQVLNVTTLGHSVIDFAWLDSTILIILVQLPDGSQQEWLGHIDPPSILLESYTIQ